MLRILLPQAYRIMLPALISQLVVVLKDTALGFIITYGEVMRTANLLAEHRLLRNPLQFYLLVGLLFIVVNYLLSKLAEYTERRIARGRRAATVRPPRVPTQAGARRRNRRLPARPPVTNAVDRRAPRRRRGDQRPVERVAPS